MSILLISKSLSRKMSVFPEAQPDCAAICDDVRHSKLVLPRSFFVNCADVERTLQLMRPLVCAALALAAVTPVFSQAPKPAPPAAPAAPGAPPAAPGALNIQQETEALINAATALFAEAKYQEALAKLAVAKKNLNNKPFEGILFTEGACHYNLNDYPKAIESLEAYVKEFPQGSAIIDVRMALGRSYIASKQEDKGIEVLTDVVRSSPEKKAEAGLIIADTLNKKGEKDKSLDILKSVLEGGIRSAESIQAAMLAANIYVSSGKLDEATALMEKVRNFASGGDSIAQMNNIYLKLGDEMMEKKSYKEALGAYQLVRKKAEISRIQNDQVAKLEAQLKKVTGVRKDEIETKLKANKEIMGEIEKRTDYDASLYYRLGRCYYEMGAPKEDGTASDASRLWQAILAFVVIVNDFKQFPQRDKCMYGLITVNAALKRVNEARQLCEKFIESFPDSEMVGEVSMMFGMLAYQNKQLKEAIDSWQRAKSFPKADKERLSFLIGSVQFEMQKFDDCRANYEALLQEFPKSTYKDDVQYRIALTYFYQNDSKSVTKAFKAYIKDNPKGQYVVDARYRLAFIDFQGGDKKSAEAQLLSLVKDAPNDQNIGQVHALLGDIYNQRGDYENAMTNFAAAVDKSKTEDVLKYAMDQVTDLYVGANKWTELADMWQRYYNTNKDDDDLALKAILWISRAKIKDGKVEDAKKLLSEHIKTRIPIVNNQQVEGLIQQLVSISAPKRRRAVAAAAPTPPADGTKPAEGTPAPAPAPAPPPAPEVTFEDVEKQLEELLSPPQAAMNGTAQMRILFAKAWLAKTMKLPDKAEKYLTIIIEVAKPDDLSPMLLAMVGDSARKKGDLEKANGCYVRLRDFYKDSEFSDGAPVGLGDIAFEKGEYDKALELFRDALNNYPGSSHVLDATQGEAKTLVKLKKYDEAKKLFEQISNTKEWRGHATANALRMLGEIEALNNKHEAAIAYFQRVFIAHQKWKDEMAKSYLLCAKSFIALGKREEAKKTLQEMLARKDLQAQTVEMKEAEKLVATL